MCSSGRGPRLRTRFFRVSGARSRFLRSRLALFVVCVCVRACVCVCVRVPDPTRQTNHHNNAPRIHYVRGVLLLLLVLAGSVSRGRPRPIVCVAWWVGVARATPTHARPRPIQQHKHITLLLTYS